MNAAETRASRAIADCTSLVVVCRSWTTAEIDTFITDVSTTSTNIAIDSRTESLVFPPLLFTGCSGRASSGDQLRLHLLELGLRDRALVLELAELRQLVCGRARGRGLPNVLVHVLL